MWKNAQICSCKRVVIPEELQQLSIAEKLLIGRIRYNRCVVRVAKGMHKMIANAVIFEHPIQKIYTMLLLNSKED